MLHFSKLEMKIHFSLEGSLKIFYYFDSMT